MDVVDFINRAGQGYQSMMNAPIARRGNVMQNALMQKQMQDAADYEQRMVESQNQSPLLPQQTPMQPASPMLPRHPVTPQPVASAPQPQRAPATKFGAVQADLAMEEIRDKKWQAEATKYENYAKPILAQASKLQGVDDKTANTIFEGLRRSALKAAEVSGNPYLMAQAEGYGAMSGLKAIEKPTAASRSQVSKDYWKKSDKSPVTFNPVSQKYFDADGKELSSEEIERVPAKASLSIGRGMRGFIQHRTIPGALFNREDGKTYVDIPDKVNGGTKRVPLDSLNIQEQTKYWTPTMQKLKQQGGVRAVNAYVAADTYKAEAEELIKLRNELKLSNPSIFSGVGSKLRKVNDISQWANMNTSDDPKLAEFIKGTTLLADVLMNAVGGAQGGQWAFELASKLLDPSLPDEAYKATIDKHMRTLMTKAKIYKDVGGTPGSSSFKEQPLLPGQTPKTPKALMPKAKGEKLNRARAIEYFKLYGSKQAAEEAAKKDGWEF